MPEALLTVIKFAAEHPWAILSIPAFFIVFHLVVIGPRSARARRLHQDRTAQRFGRDLHTKVLRSASERGRKE